MYAAVVRKAGPAEGHRGGRRGAFLPVQESQFHLLEPLRVLWLTGCAQRRVLRSLPDRIVRSSSPRLRRRGALARRLSVRARVARSALARGVKSCFPRPCTEGE